jgi:hypothetical protein
MEKRNYVCTWLTLKSHKSQSFFEERFGDLKAKGAIWLQERFHDLKAQGCNFCLIKCAANFIQFGTLIPVRKCNL